MAYYTLSVKVLEVGGGGGDPTLPFSSNAF